MSDDPSHSERQSPTSGQGGSKPKPLLASEALMEDIAPQEPWRVGARWWSIALGVLLAATALPALAGPPVGTPSAAIAPHLGIGLSCLVVGAAPLPYVWRALAMLLVAIITFVSGVAGVGPLAALAPALGQWSLVHALAAVGLPAALLFRERYRAYTGARYLLASALVLALPFVAYSLLTLIDQPSGGQVASGIAVGTVFLSLFGFMGSNTGVGGKYLASVVLAGITLQLAGAILAGSWPPDATAAPTFIALAAFVCAALLGALGAAQLFAARSWTQARAVDLRGDTTTDRPPMPSVGSDSWSGGQ